MHTTVVDEGVNVPWTGLNLLERLLDRLITHEINLNCFNGVGQLWTFLVEGLNHKLDLLQRTTVKKDVIGLVRLQKHLDGLIADAIVAASDENNL